MRNTAVRSYKPPPYRVSECSRASGRAVEGKEEHFSLENVRKFRFFGELWVCQNMGIEARAVYGCVHKIHCCGSYGFYHFFSCFFLFSSNFSRLAMRQCLHRSSVLIFRSPNVHGLSISSTVSFTIHFQFFSLITFTIQFLSVLQVYMVGHIRHIPIFDSRSVGYFTAAHVHASNGDQSLHETQTIERAEYPSARDLVQCQPAPTESTSTARSVQRSRNRHAN